MDKTAANVRRATQNSYEITFWYNDERCRERVKGKPTAANDVKMNKFLAAIEHAIEEGTFDYIETFPRSKTARKFEKQLAITMLSNYLVDWFAIKKQNLRASTVKTNGNIIKNFLIPTFGELYLHELKRYHIKRAVVDWDVSRKVTNNRLSVLRTALDDAVDDELIENNVLYGWTYHHKKEEPKTDDDINPLERVEMMKFLDNLVDEERNIFQTLFFTGMRPSEAVCLLWSDVVFNNLAISINKAQTDDAAAAEIPKTSASNRTIKILQPAYDALKSQQKFTYMDRGLVFKNPRTGEPWKVGRLYKIWARVLKKLEIEHRRMYQTRHTYASMMLSAGEPIMWVAKQMGHTNWVLLGRIYAKWIPSTNPDAGNKAVDIFWN